MARSRKTARKTGGQQAGAAAPRGQAAEASPDRIIDATMELIAGRGWRTLSLADIAAATGLTLAQLYAVFPSKRAVLGAFERRINEQTLSAAVGADETIRDRLFDLVMRRLDALAPYKPAIKVLVRDLPWDPAVALCGGPRFLNAMRWMAESAGVDTGGIAGLLRVKGLAAVYLATLRAWVNDDSADNAKTLAALDRALKQAEFFARSLPGFSRAAPSVTA
jgi:AcrR family transcriptional regulator